MDIFITWSGPRSLAVAEALNEYLPMIVNAFKPWLSKNSIDKGANWGIELTTALANARAGIICLTPNNLEAPWILFEAGAIAKTVAEKPLACTLLIGLESSDVTGPLALFQATKPSRDDLLQLVKTLNKAVGNDAPNVTQVEKAFDVFWPKLEERLANLPQDGPTQRPQRDPRDLLEEILDTVRSTSQQDTELLAHLVGEMADLKDSLTSPITNLYTRTVPLSSLSRGSKISFDSTSPIVAGASANRNAFAGLASGNYIASDADTGVYGVDGKPLYVPESGAEETGKNE